MLSLLVRALVRLLVLVWAGGGGKAGSKLHLAGDAGGLPLAVVVSAANANDSTMPEAVDDIPPIRMPSGRRRRRPAKLHAEGLRSSPLPRLPAPAGDPTAARPPLGWSPRSGLAATGGSSSGPGPGLAVATDPLRALLRTLLRAGDAGLLDHLFKASNSHHADCSGMSSYPSKHQPCSSS